RRHGIAAPSRKPRLFPHCRPIARGAREARGSATAFHRPGVAHLRRHARRHRNSTCLSKEQGRMRTIAGAIVVLMIPSLAWAGGEEFPDNGAQALSRGGAFTAKADDLTALQYNVAGLAKVRGTRLLLSVNLVNADASFTRAGSYPVNAGSP